MSIKSIIAKCARLEEEQKQAKDELLKIIKDGLDNGSINLAFLAIQIEFVVDEEEVA